MARWRDGNVVINLYHVFYAEKSDDTNIRVHLRGKRMICRRYETETERDERFDDLMGAMQKQTLLPGPIEAVEAMRGSMI